MTKAELDILEKAFAAEIVGSVYQTKSKVATRLEQEGFLIVTTLEHKDALGTLHITGYNLTVKGNFAYCQSSRCK